MTIQPSHLVVLLEQMNGGRAADALLELDRLHTQLPGHPGVLSLRAEALRLAGRGAEAIEAFKQAGEKGAGARNWLAAGVLLSAERATDEAVRCLLKALEESPDSEDILDALITALFNGNRHRDGIEFARRQLTISANPTLLSRAALLLQGNDLYEESSNAFKRIVQLAPQDPATIGAALVPARFTCEWEWIESLQKKIGAWYDQGNFSAPQEFPLTHVTWCADEARNLGVTRAYLERMVGRPEPIGPSAARAPGGRIRVGYVSCDFRNHATMHLMAGLLEHHDRERFEVFAYDYTGPDISEYRQRFLNAVEHLVPIHTMSDRQAATRIAADQLDILFDLKLYTGGGRSGIVACRPAPLQAAYLGFPGSAACPDIDYIVSDRYVTPDSSARWYTEKFCRLPHTYQCNDRKRFAPPTPNGRAMHGLPEDRVVFGAFNQSYKVDRASFAVWMRILEQVPDSVLWLLGQSEAAVANVSRHAQLAGIEPGRLIFAPFAAPNDHLARLQLADAVLDTLVCNGHTTTSDALWAGVPVITAKGRHFASRVSESLLNAMNLPELVGADHDDMVRIARRIGTDAAYRCELRARVSANRLNTPLFDTARLTRDFETAIEMMVARQRSGLPLEHIDVPDQGPVQPRADAPQFVGRVSALQAAFPACPLCGGASVTLGFANCTTHAQWHEPLPPSIEWMRCPTCAHVHSRHHWTAAGLNEIGRKRRVQAPADLAAAMEAGRPGWTAVVEKVVALLGGYRSVIEGPDRPVWVDVGTGDGSLVLAASDFGFAAIGLDTAAEVVAQIQQLGFNAVNADFTTLRFELSPRVLSMMGLLQQIPDVRAALLKAARILPPAGVLVVGLPDMQSSSWKLLDAATVNPFWTQIENLHNFGRERIVALLRECDFDVVDFAVPNRNKAEMELYAVRRPHPAEPTSK